MTCTVYIHVATFDFLMQLNWLATIQDVFNAVDITIEADEPIVVVNPDYFDALSTDLENFNFNYT